MKTKNTKAGKKALQFPIISNTVSLLENDMIDLFTAVKTIEQRWADGLLCYDDAVTAIRMFCEAIVNG